MDTFIFDKPSLMFHEIMDSGDVESGWHLRSNGKYTISKNKFHHIIDTFGNNVNYTFDDGGISNLYAANQLKSIGIKGIFFICSNYVGKPGFLDLSQIKEISKNHYIYSHGHKHIMKKVSYSDLFFDWDNSLNYMKKNNFETHTICLPGGYFTPNHKKLFGDLGIKYIFHSAPSNLILNTLYESNFIFIPRVIVTEKFKSIKKTNYIAIKSLFKQVVDRFNMFFPSKVTY